MGFDSNNSGLEITYSIIETLPRIIFFTMSSLIVLFWSELISRITNNYNGGLLKRIICGILNSILLLIQICFWLVLFLYYELHPDPMFCKVEDGVFAFAYLILLVFIIFFGIKLYLLLKKFPEKDHTCSHNIEIILITFLCALSFGGRSIFLFFGVFSVHPVTLEPDEFKILFYITVEILPSLLVLIILYRIPNNEEDRVIEEGQEEDRHNHSTGSLHNSFEDYQSIQHKKRSITASVLNEQLLGSSNIEISSADSYGDISTSTRSEISGLFY